MKLLSDNISILLTKRKGGYFGDILLLIFLSFALRLAALKQTIYANGWDAYFYLIQIKSWIEEGAMHSSDDSLIYPLMRVICWLSGDYVFVFKITSALLATLFVLLIYLWGRKTTSYGIAIILTFYFLWSPHLTWFAAQYPKNLLGVNLLLSLMISFKSRWWWLPFLFLIVNYFGHRMTFVLAGIYLVIYFFGKMFFGQLSLNRKLRKGVFVIVGVLFFLIFITPVFSGTLSFLDFERLNGVMTNQPHFAPLTFFEEFNQGDRLSFFWKIEIFFCVVFYLVGVLFLFKKIIKQVRKNGGGNTLDKLRETEQFAFFVLCSILIFPFLKWSLTSMSFRFVLVFIFLSPLFFVSTIPYFKIQKRNTKGILVIVSILLLVVSFFSWKSYNPQLHDAPYGKYAQVTQQTFDFLKDKNPELVIAHNSLAEYFTFTTGIDALPWQPEYKIAADQLWRIVADVRLPIFRTYLSENDFKNLKRIGVNYFVIQETVWQQFKATLLENEEFEILDKINTWRNPYKLRPSFLLKKK